MSISLVTPKETVLSFISKEKATIEHSYAAFCKANDLTDFPEATLSLQKIKKVYAQLWQEKQEEDALKLKPEIDALEQQVQKMNMAFSGPTRQDFSNIAAAFTPPAESVYIDAETKQKYWMPDHSKLAATALKFFASCEFQGTSVQPGKRVIHPQTGEVQKCDVLFITKFEEQVAYEQGDYELSACSLIRKYGLSAMFWHSKSEIEERMKKQKECVFQAAQLLSRNCTESGYASFLLCGEKELTLLGFSEKAAQSKLAIIFYHKRIST